MLDLTQHPHKELPGDKGHVGNDLARSLLRHGLVLITPVCQTMKRLPASSVDKAQINGRNIVETIIGHIKALLSFRPPEYQSVGYALTHIIAYQINFRAPKLIRAFIL